MEKSLYREAMYAGLMYDQYKHLNRHNFRRILKRATYRLPFYSRGSLLKYAMKKADFSSTKEATYDQAKHFFRASLYRITKDLGGQMHVNGEGAVNFPKFDGIKGFDGEDYFTADKKQFLVSVVQR